MKLSLRLLVSTKDSIVFLSFKLSLTYRLRPVSIISADVSINKFLPLFIFQFLGIVGRGNGNSRFIVISGVHYTRNTKH